jgi:hypothetical protein
MRLLVIPFSPKFESNDVTHEQSREESKPNPDDDYCAVPISDSWIGPELGLWHRLHLAGCSGGWPGMRSLLVESSQLEWLYHC